jgi:PIN domain nuclease of toxin-antitoxin system
LILLDTVAWVRWVGEPSLLSRRDAEIIEASRGSGLGVSVISCCETAWLISRKRLIVSETPLEWIRRALEYPGVRLIPLTPEIAAEAAELPGEFHRDPGDRLLVATARVLRVPILTTDHKIHSYQHVLKV